jgi:hypothetical protein
MLLLLFTNRISAGVFVFQQPMQVITKSSTPMVSSFTSNRKGEPFAFSLVGYHDGSQLLR